MDTGFANSRKSSDHFSRTGSSAGHYSDGGISNASDVSSGLLDALSATLAEVDSYISLYESRIKLEEDFVRNLRSMNERQKDLDAKVNSNLMSNTSLVSDVHRCPGLRGAWFRLRENDVWELEARSQMIRSCRQTVLAPLLAFRVSYERIRKRVKEDLYTSLAQYDEMRNVTLPRIRRAYEKKAEEVDQFQQQTQAIEDQRMLLSNRSVEKTDRDAYGTHSRAPSSPDRNGFAAADPAAASFRRNGSHQHSRNQSDGSNLSHRSDDKGSLGSPHFSHSTLPSTSHQPSPLPSPGHDKSKNNFFDQLKTREGWDNARKEAPKKINALLSRMRDGKDSGYGDTQSSSSSVVDNITGNLGLANKSTQTVAIKQAKAKRDTSEADRAYRKAIFDLETLRMRRARTLKAAAASVIECRTELTLTSQAAWAQYEQAMVTFHDKGSTRHERSSDIIQSAMTGFEQELKSIEENLPAVEDSRVSYVNYWHGELKNLIFGTPLTDYPLTIPYRLSDTVTPPLIVIKSIEFIEAYALDVPGIYRTSARQSSVKQLSLAIEKDELGFQFEPTKDEPAAVAGVFKDYLRQLPEPVLAIPWAERIKYTHERDEHIRTGFAVLKGKIRRLPPIHQTTLKVIMQHLSKVAEHADQNKMNAANLSVVFSPCLLSETDHETTSVAAAMEEDKTLEDMILFCKDIFDLKTAGAPLLPPISSTQGGDLSRAGQHAADAAFASSASSSGVPSPSDVPIVGPESINLKRSNAITPAATAESDAASAEPTTYAPGPSSVHRKSSQNHAFSAQSGYSPHNPTHDPATPSSTRTVLNIPPARTDLKRSTTTSTTT